MIKFFILTIPYFFCSLFANAALETQVEDFLKNRNKMAEGSSYDPTYLEDYLLDRGVLEHQPILDLTKVQVAIPLFKDSCDSIDIINGGLDAANSIDMGLALAKITKSKGASAFAYIVGMEAVSPLTASAMKQVQTWANQLNAINISSCESAELRTQGPVVREEGEAAYLCQQVMLASGEAKDRIEARRRCSNRATRKKTLARANEKYRNLLSGNYNIADKVLALSPAISSATKTLFTTITGTIVVKEGKGIEVYPPRYKQVIEYLCSGQGMNQAYGLKKDGVSLEEIALPERINERERTLELMKAIAEKMTDDTPFTADEVDLLNRAPLPLGNIISLLTQYKGKGASLALGRYGDLIVYNRALQFVEEAMLDMLHKAYALKAIQTCSYALEEYIRQIQDALQDIQRMKQEYRDKSESEQRALESMIRLDHLLRKAEKAL